MSIDWIQALVTAAITVALETAVVLPVGILITLWFVRNRLPDWIFELVQDEKFKKVLSSFIPKAMNWKQMATMGISAMIQRWMSGMPLIPQPQIPQPGPIVETPPPPPP